MNNRKAPLWRGFFYKYLVSISYFLLLRKLTLITTVIFLKYFNKIKINCVIKHMDYWTVLSSLLSALFGGALWSYMGKRLNAEQQIKKLDYQTEGLLLDNLIERVDRLEDLLTTSSEEKEAMRIQIGQLTVQVTELKIEIKFLREENKRLRNGNQSM
jgi:hypothetical protein